MEEVRAIDTTNNSIKIDMILFTPLNLFQVVFYCKYIYNYPIEIHESDVESSNSFPKKLNYKIKTAPLFSSHNSPSDYGFSKSTS